MLSNKKISKKIRRKDAQGKTSSAQGRARIVKCTKCAQMRATKGAQGRAQGETSSAKGRARSRKLKCPGSRAGAMGRPAKTLKTGVNHSLGVQGRRARTRKVAQGQASRAQGCARISTWTKRAQRRARKDARKVAQGQTSSANARARTRKLTCSCSRACAMGHPPKT